MNDSSYFPASEQIFIGQAAQQALSGASCGSVAGITSRGPLIKTDRSWVIFLTGEAYGGPLTINLHNCPPRWNTIRLGSPVTLRRDFLSFAEAGISISLDQAQVWTPPQRPARTQATARQHEAMLEIARQILDQRRGAGFSGTLSDLLPIPGGGSGSSSREILLLKSSLLQADLQAALSALGQLTGLGCGLTPSGDDLTAGLLLALNRWQDELRPRVDLEGLNSAAVQIAYQKTTLLSANLIDCAAQGQADCRLLAALDGVLSGNASPQACAQALLQWGNSSGCDAFTGMVLAIQCGEAAAQE
jgi:hypothetical protein